MVVVREKFPPHDFTEDEAAAVVGRYVENPERRPAPEEGGRFGRTPAAPHGVVYVRADPRETAEPAEPAEPAEVEAEEFEEVDLEGWTVPELKGALDEAGVDYPANARKAELIELLEGVEE